jgi:hypothetical protein
MSSCCLCFGWMPHASANAQVTDPAQWSTPKDIAGCLCHQSEHFVCVMMHASIAGTHIPGSPNSARAASSSAVEELLGVIARVRATCPGMQLQGFNQVGVAVADNPDKAKDIVEVGGCCWGIHALCALLHWDRTARHVRPRCSVAALHHACASQVRVLYPRVFCAGIALSTAGRCTPVRVVTEAAERAWELDSWGTPLTQVRAHQIDHSEQT